MTRVRWRGRRGRRRADRVPPWHGPDARGVESFAYGRGMGTAVLARAGMRSYCSAREFVWARVVNAPTQRPVVRRVPPASFAGGNPASVAAARGRPAGQMNELVLVEATSFRHTSNPERAAISGRPST